MGLVNTHLGPQGIAALLEGKERLWFSGIGGVHMASLALMSRERGFTVGGSDASEGESVLRLRRAGIPVCVGHSAAHVENANADAVIYTLALSPDNPEYVAAREAGIPLVSRADYLGYITSAFPHRIGVAGSHGKSTVTAMLAEVFMAAGRSPTVFCGADLPRLGSPVVLGRGEDVIFEACEYQRSFLSLSPTVALLLNAEWDHVDTYPTREETLEAFGDFAALTGAFGRVVYNGEDEGLARILAGKPRNAFSFGLTAGDCHARDLFFEEGMGCFTLVLGKEECGRVRLSVPGEHNVKNALAAALGAALSFVPPKAICAGLSAFRGAARRMEYKGTLCGAALYDDYAHHPTEIAASLRTARTLVGGGGRLFLIFQSHTYSRTAAFFFEICEALALADRVLVADIYPARERDTLGMSGEVLARGVGEKARYVGGVAEMAGALVSELRRGDVAVVMGAGDIDRIFAQFSAKDFTIKEKSATINGG